MMFVLVDVFAIVIDLDCGLLEVGQPMEDAVVWHPTVEGIAMRLLVRVDAVVTVVVELLHLDDVSVGSVSLAVRHEHHQLVLHTLVVALRQEQPVGDTSGTLVLLQVELCATGQGLLSLVVQGQGTWHVRHCH